MTAKIGVKEAERRAMRERRAKDQTTGAMVAAVDGPKKVQPPAEPETKESNVSKKPAKAAAPKAKAKAKAPPKAKAAAPAKKKIASAKGVDRSPLRVGSLIVNYGDGSGVSMAVLEKTFKMKAHPLRSKIHAAKHKLGFTIEYDAKTKLYSGHAPVNPVG